MRYRGSAAGLLLAMLAPEICGADPEEPAVQGDYVESRTCNVWTGSCFANGEINLIGKEAIVGWRITKGTWAGADLAGRRMVAVIQAEGTLQTPYQGKVKAVLFIDREASEAQGRALVGLAKSLAPDSLADPRVERGEISFTRKGPAVALEVGSELRVSTAPICPDEDCTSCTAARVYPPLGASAEVDCAKGVENLYRGDALGGSRWSCPGLKGAMVGRFAR